LYPGDFVGIRTPGHTDDSYSFIMPDRVFTGDTLLICGTGRTDFQVARGRGSWRLPIADRRCWPALRGNRVDQLNRNRSQKASLGIPNLDFHWGRSINAGTA
jgi:glyoxylase-like metal-dependent hydrolase (beta-lactamase superfamily II)